MPFNSHLSILVLTSLPFLMLLSSKSKIKNNISSHVHSLVLPPVFLEHEWRRNSILCISGLRLPRKQSQLTLGSSHSVVLVFLKPEVFFKLLGGAQVSPPGEQHINAGEACENSLMGEFLRGGEHMFGVLCPLSSAGGTSLRTSFLSDFRVALETRSELWKVGRSCPSLCSPG